MSTDISVLAKKIETDNRLMTEGGGNTLATYATGIDAKFRICQMLQQSQILPKALSTPQAILAVVLMGQEFGFAPLISCHIFDFIQGRATMRAAGMAALCTKEGGTFHVISNTSTSCKIRAVRPSRKWEETFEFTLEMAKRMGLAGKDNWIKNPEAMLYARCVSVLARRGWADVLGGLKSSEEMQDEEIVEGEPEPTTVRVMESVEARTTEAAQAITAEFAGQVDAEGEVIEEAPKHQLSDLKSVGEVKARQKLEQLKLKTADSI